MNQISIFGIGYVGIVQAVGFARGGFDVVVYDKNPAKNANIQNKVSSIVEPKVQEYLEKYFSKIQVAKDAQSALQATEISFICVGTPSREDGSVNLDAIFDFAREAGEILSNETKRHIFVIRSTIPPGTSRRFIQGLEQSSGKKYGIDFGVVMQPEFLREGSGIDDFFAPPFTILGTDNAKDAEALREMYAKLGIKENIFAVSFEEAEFFKYLNNVFHAMKISFANEVAQMSAKFSIDPVKLMNIFIRDTRQNISSYYLFPGMPFGGYCLPKDTRGLRRILEAMNVETALVPAILASNENHYQFIFQRLLEMFGPAKRIGLLGITFKQLTENTVSQGIDDIRESPAVRIFQFLKSRGLETHFYDPIVDRRRILGANLAYVQSLFQNFFDYQTTNIKDFIQQNDVIVIGPGNGLRELLKTKHELKGKKIVCLNPFLYTVLEKEKMTFEKIF